MKSITENGNPMETAAEIKFLLKENNRFVFQLGSGNYMFASETND
jgi:hypothetical protein